jgi:hypothetical protein
MKKALFICEECQAVFDRDVRRDNDGKWGHICKDKKYKSGHRCESYLDKYVLSKRTESQWIKTKPTIYPEVKNEKST